MPYSIATLTRSRYASYCTYLTNYSALKTFCLSLLISFDVGFVFTVYCVADAFIVYRLVSVNACVYILYSLFKHTYHCLYILQSFVYVYIFFKASDGIIILCFVLILPLRYFTRLFINELLLMHVCRAYACMHSHLHTCCSFTSSSIIVYFFQNYFAIVI